MQVIIADDRPLWMKKEDMRAVCMIRCPLYKRCSSRFGTDCNRLGGTEIPKINRKDDRHAKHSRRFK